MRYAISLGLGVVCLITSVIAVVGAPNSTGSFVAVVSGFGAVVAVADGLLRDRRARRRRGA